MALAAIALLLASAELSIHWEAPAECPSVRAIEAELERLIGRTVRFGEPAALTASAVVREPWIADVALTTARGTHQRELSANTCEDLARAFALVLSLALDETNEPVPVPVPVPERAGEYALSTGLLADVGTMPSAAFGIAADARWWPIEQLSIGTGVQILLRRRMNVRLEPPAGADMTVYAARASTCWHAALFSELTGSACGGAELDSFSARGFGVHIPRRQTARWLAPLASVSAALPAGDHVALSLWLDALFPISRPIFVLEGVGELHRTPRLLVRTGLAAEVRFP